MLDGVVWFIGLFVDFYDVMFDVLVGVFVDVE